MANLVTLSSTTLPEPLSRDANEVKLTSTSGVLPGMRLYVDKESMEVVRLLTSPWVYCKRGQDGTGGAIHPNGAIVWIAEAYQLYQRDPTGLPLTELLVSPWINTLTGDVFFARGDAVGAGATTNLRHWVKQTTTWTEGALGIVTISQDPSAST